MMAFGIGLVLGVLAYAAVTHRDVVARVWTELKGMVGKR